MTFNESLAPHTLGTISKNLTTPFVNCTIHFNCLVKGCFLLRVVHYGILISTLLYNRGTGL